MTKSGFDLDEIERLLAAATPGEWVVTEGVEISAGNLGAIIECMYSENQEADEANAALIVALHNSAPAILTEIRELRAENARLREALSHAQGRFLNINIALSSGGTKREAIRIADVGEDCAKNALARAALGEPQ